MALNCEQERHLKISGYVGVNLDFCCAVKPSLTQRFTTLASRIGGLGEPSGFIDTEVAYIDLPSGTISHNFHLLL